jgi:hypothetical protein
MPAPPAGRGGIAHSEGGPARVGLLWLLSILWVISEPNMSQLRPCHTEPVQEAPGQLAPDQEALDQEAPGQLAPFQSPPVHETPFLVTLMRTCGSQGMP